MFSRRNGRVARNSRVLLSVVLVYATLAGCGRSLTTNEREFLERIHGDALNVEQVRIHQSPFVGRNRFTRPARPRETCSEKILPPVQGEAEYSVAAVVLFSRVFYAPDFYYPDFLPQYPETISLNHAMRLAHEMTHVWQWQQRQVTGYSPWRAAMEHQATSDPYLFEISRSADFLDFGYEQQGAIVGEYVCCRVLDPKGARTRRLHELVGEHLPLAPLPQQHESREAILPWREDIKGICG